MRESAACQDCLLEHAENVGGIGDGGLKRFWTLDIGKCHFGCLDVWLWSVSRFRGFASSVHPAHHLTSPPWPLPPRRLPHSSLHPTTLAIPIYQRQHSPSPALLSIPRRYCSSPSDSPRPVAYTHTHTRTPTLHLHSDPPPIVSARPPPKPTPAQPRSQSQSLPESTTPYPPSNGRILLVKNSPLPPYTSALHNSLVHPTSARR